MICRPCGLSHRNSCPDELLSVLASQAMSNHGVVKALPLKQTHQRAGKAKNDKELLACRPCNSQRSPLSRPNTSVWNEHCTDSCRGFTLPFTVSLRHPDSPASASLPAETPTSEAAATAESQQSSHLRELLAQGAELYNIHLVTSLLQVPSTTCSGARKGQSQKGSEEDRKGGN